MTAILNGIFLILIGGTSAIFGPAVCERHGERGLGVGVSITGIMAVALGVANIRDGLDGPDVVTFTDTVYAMPSYSREIQQAIIFDTVTYETWTKHDLGYVADTVQAVTVPHRSGAQWYVKTVDGEAWSDRYPKKLEE
jgi:hypothetical protein